MVKRFFFLLMLMVLCIADAWADEVSEKDAQASAKSFVNNYFGKKGGDRSELKSQGQMEKLGFYVFNMTDKGGFVIVSNESETMPILGYSETGSIELDPDKMPENLRNWLQGYADEIAWLQKQENYGKIKIKSVSNTKARTRSHVTTAIEPLVKTKWDQGVPYNNLCPPYSNTRNCATGCVATAMAQVMKYHEWPTAQTATIPAYTDSYGEQRSKLDPTTFDWGNMLNSYSGSYTDDQATAVATLMKYCGYSVKMDYDYESASNTNMVAIALREYFGYKTTTQWVSRSYYTYDKWKDLIYYELEHGRPVVYGGQSSGGGHEFVCDGYIYQNGDDYFHINWGWGGSNDEYYLLSSLNPNGAQGIGGSISDDGFHYGQDAVIGIQKSTDTGSMSGITPNVVSLTANSMTLSNATTNFGNTATIILDESVNITLNITNNSSDNYDGDIYVGRKIVQGGNTGYELLEGNVFKISANQSADCVIPFTPSQTGTYNLVFFWPNASGSYSTDGNVLATLTVVDVTPKGLTASDITSNSAELSWTQDGMVTEWILAYKVSSAADFREINIGTNPYTLANLLPETQYTVKVRPIIENYNDKWSSDMSFTTEAIYPVPKNLTVSEITPTTSMISWTGKAEATSFNLRYGLVTEGSTTSTWLQYDNGNSSHSLGTGSTITWGVMYPGSMVKGNKLTKVKIYETNNNSEDITINIYSGGTNAPGTLLYTEVITPLQNGFHEVTLASAVNITPVENLWITLTETGDYPVAYCETSEPNNQWILNGSSWVNIGDVATQFSNSGWMIRAYMEVPVYTSGVEISDVTSPYQLTGLNPESNYLVQVQAVYGNETSDWCESSFFTTPSGIVLDDMGNNTEVITETANQPDNEVNVSLTNRTLYKDCAWNTLCLPFDMTSQQINAEGSPLKDAVIKELDTETTYNFGEDGSHKTSLDNNGKLYLIFKTAESIEAGKPYIVKWTTAGDPIKNPMFEGVTVKSTAADNSANSGTKTAVSSQDGSVSFIGTYKTQTFNETDGSILFLGVNEGKSTLYYPQPDLSDPNNPKYPSIGAQRAYFKLSAPSAQVRGFELNFGDDEQTTGIFDVKGKNENKGVNAWYDLSGRKLSIKPSAKGVYIQGGKKVVIK